MTDPDIKEAVRLARYLIDIAYKTGYDPRFLVHRKENVKQAAYMLQEALKPLIK